MAEPALQGTDNNRGFALIAILWLITALAAVVGLALAGGHLGALASRNRVMLARGRWAAEACLAIAQARWVEHRLGDTATIDLGRTTACRWHVEDPTARLNVNTAGGDELLRALGSDSFVSAVLEARRSHALTDLGQLHGLAGWDSTMASLLTVDGPGTVNASSASPPLLAALPGMTPEAVEVIVSRRAYGRPVNSLDALAAELSPPARTTLLASYADLARQLTFAPPQLLVTADGWVGTPSEAPFATIQVLVVPLPERLAVIRRRVW
jgi:type II secretory pathway component PulK